MFRTFEAQTADELWQKIATVFRAKGQTLNQKSRAGKTNEILHAALSISDPRQRCGAAPCLLAGQAKSNLFPQKRLFIFLTQRHLRSGNAGDGARVDVA
jgi:hypothetical protein